MIPVYALFCAASMGRLSTDAIVLERRVDSPILMPLRILKLGGMISMLSVGDVASDC